MKNHAKLLRTVGAVSIPILKQRRGIYFLLSGDRIVYVGKTEDVTRRLGEHINLKNFDEAFFVPIDTADLSIFELALIRIFQPELNDARDKNRFSPDDFTIARTLLPVLSLPSIKKKFYDEERRRKLPRLAPDAVDSDAVALLSFQ